MSIMPYSLVTITYPLSHKIFRDYNIFIKFKKAYISCFFRQQISIKLYSIVILYVYGLLIFSWWKSSFYLTSGHVYGRVHDIRYSAVIEGGVVAQEVVEEVVAGPSLEQKKWKLKKYFWMFEKRSISFN